jgi:hypothetical protein
MVPTVAHGTKCRPATLEGVGGGLYDERVFIIDGGCAMTMEALREFVRREPFAAFVIRLSNGEQHAVRHPECIALTRSQVVVTYPDEDRVVHCGLIHVNSVEALQHA